MIFYFYKNIEMHRFILLVTFLISGQVLTSQSNTTLRPILLDKEALSGIGLQKIKPKDTPERDFFQKRLYGGKEISVYVVSSQSWTVPFDAFWFDEFIYILHGKGKVHLDDQEDMIFNSGEYFFAPKGFPGKWEVQAGDNYHYELSVITNKRADSTDVSPTKAPHLLDKSIMSGVDITWDEDGLYQEILADGIELQIFLKAEQPRTVDIASWQKEQLISVQSGIIKLTDSDGEEHTYYAGDFFVLPETYKGTWQSQGHSLCKYVVVQKKT